MPATAPCSLMNLTSRFSGSTKASSQMPRSPTVPQPRRSTLVDSTTTRPAPPAANLPAFIRCQSVGKPFTAEYWCIGGTTIRLRKDMSRIENGENSFKSVTIHFPRTLHLVCRRRYRPQRNAERRKSGGPRGLRAQAMQIWDGVKPREAIGERTTNNPTTDRGRQDERSDPASAQCRARLQQRNLPEPARVCPQGARQP